MEIRPVLGSAWVPPAAGRVAASVGARAVDGVSLGAGLPSGVPVLPLAFGGLFANPQKAALAAVAERLMGNGVQFQRRKKFLFWTLDSWKPATASDVAKAVLKGRAHRLQAATSGLAWSEVKDQHDLSLLDAFHGSGTPTSLPHAVLARTLLDLERSRVRVTDGEAPVGAYAAYKRLAENGRELRIAVPRGRELAARTQDEALFAGWLHGHARKDELAHPKLAEVVQALFDRGVDTRLGGILETYRELQQAPPARPLTLWTGDVELGRSHVGAASDPARFTAALDRRQAELDATRKAIGERALEAWDLLRQDGDPRPFAQRLEAVSLIFATGAKSPGAMYDAARGAQGALEDRAREAAALLTALTPALESRAVALYGRLQALPPADRQPMLDRVAAAVPTFLRLMEILPRSGHDEALDMLLAVDEATLSRVERIARNVAPWKAEGTWTVGRAEDGSLTIADNRSGRYADSSNTSLTTPSFTVPTPATLTWDLRHALEETHDWVKVEVAEEGCAWRELAHYTGHATRAESLDLSALAGRQVQLRFRFHSDGSKTYEGVRIARPAVGGRPLHDLTDESVSRALTGGLDAPALEALAALSERLGDARGAAALLPCIDPSAPDVAERIEALSGIAKEWSVAGALAAWPVLTGSTRGTLAERAAALRGARAMVEATSREVTVDGVLRLYARLEGADAGTGARLLETVKGARAFRAEGKWAEVDGGRSDSPGARYADNHESSVTTETLSLQGRQGTKLTFHLKSDLESSCDWAFVEVSRGDGRWATAAKLTGAADASQSVDLSAYDGQRIKLRLRLKSDATKNGDGVTFGNLRIQDDKGHDAALADQINAPLLRELVDAAAAPGGMARLDAIHRMAEAAGSAQDALLAWPLVDPHLGQPGWDEKIGVMIDLLKDYGTQAAVDAWPRIEAVGPASYRERHATFVAAHRMAETLYQGNRGARAADIYEALARVGSDRALADSLMALASRGRAFECEGTWGRVDGGEWQDSPGKPYGSGVDASLTTQPFSLVGVRDARLKLDARYAFEETHDWCAVEVSDDEKSWKQVARWTGSGAASEVDLSRWDGKRIQVRFRVHTDGSREADGISLKAMRVTGAGGVDTPLEDLVNSPLGRELLAAASAPYVPLELRSRNLQAVAGMADGLKSTVKAALLWPLLAPSQMDADFEDRATALTGLASAYGVEAAFGMWPAVTAAGGPALLADRVALLRASMEASKVLYRDTTLEKALRVYHRLAASGADRGVFDRLGGLIRQAPAWKAEGAWSPFVDESGRPGWDDSPGAPYGSGVDASLTTAPFSLQGLKECRLRLEVRHALEAGCDHVFLEASENGREWIEEARWTGESSGRVSREVDLGRWCGKSLQLRLRLKSDGSKESQGFTASDLRLAVVDASGARAEVPLDDAVNAPLTNELLDAATDTRHSTSDRALSLAVIEKMAAKLGSPQAASLLWPALSARVGAPDFEAVAEQVGELAARFGVSATVAVMPVVQAEGQGTLAERVALFSGAHALVKDALSPARQVDGALEAYRSLVKGGSAGQVAPALAGYSELMQAWEPQGRWGQEIAADGRRVWSDSPGGAYADGVSASLTSAPFLVEDGCRLTFKERHQTEQTHDYCAVEVSANGADWTEALRLTGSGAEAEQTVDLAGYAGKTVQVRFRMHADGSKTADGVSLWDVQVRQGGRAAAIEDAANEPFLKTVIAAATDPTVDAAERAATLEFLRGLPPGWGRRVLDFHGRQGPGGMPLSVLVGRVAEGLALGADLDTCLTRALRAGRKEGKVEVGEDAVVVGGIRVERKKSAE